MHFGVMPNGGEVLHTCLRNINFLQRNTQMPHHLVRILSGTSRSAKAGHRNPNYITMG